MKLVGNPLRVRDPLLYGFGGKRREERFLIRGPDLLVLSLPSERAGTPVFPESGTPENNRGHRAPERPTVRFGPPRDRRNSSVTEYDPET